MRDLDNTKCQSEIVKKWKIRSPWAAFHEESWKQPPKYYKIK